MKDIIKNNKVIYLIFKIYKYMYTKLDLITNSIISHDILAVYDK